MTNPLAYTTPELPDDSILKISPSSFAKFVNSPHTWYRDEVLKENPFTHNTSTVIGTIVHYCAEMISKNEEVDQAAIDDYIDSFEIHDEYDPDLVRQHYVLMAETLVNFYVLENEMFEAETKHVTGLGEGFYVGGTLDRLEGTKEDCMICDYKTYNSKTKPKTIPSNYKYQLLVYAFLLFANGYNPTRIRLIYINRNIDGGTSDKTGKPLKSYPPEVTVLTDIITDEDMEFIQGLLDLCVDTYKTGVKYPELLHVIYHDPRLRV